jgi:hypothetical protein
MIFDMVFVGRGSTTIMLMLGAPRAAGTDADIQAAETGFARLMLVRTRPNL